MQWKGERQQETPSEHKEMLFILCVLNTGTGVEPPSTKIQNLAGYSPVRPALSWHFFGQGWTTQFGVVTSHLNGFVILGKILTCSSDASTRGTIRSRALTWFPTYTRYRGRICFDVSEWEEGVCSPCPCHLAEAPLHVPADNKLAFYAQLTLESQRQVVKKAPCAVSVDLCVQV